MGANNKIFLKAIAAGVTFALLLSAADTGRKIWPEVVNLLQPTTNMAGVSNVPQGIFRYGGSTTFAPLRNPGIVKRISQAHPGYELVYMEPPSGHKPGSGIGIKMLLDGQLSFSQSSRPVKTEEYNTAQNRNFKLEQIPIAIDGIVIYVNREVDVTGLTVSQVKDIFTGKITNWKQINPTGINLAITPISRDPNDGGTPEFFQEMVLGKTPIISKQYARDTTASIRKVATTPGAIGYASAPEVCDQSSIRPLAIAKDNNQNFVNACIDKKVNQSDLAKDIYPITRRLFVVIKRDGGQLDEKSGEAYANMLLTDEGQEIINQVGLVPLRGISQPSQN